MLMAFTRVRRVTGLAALAGAGLMTAGLLAASPQAAELPIGGFADIADRAMPAYVDITTTQQLAAAQQPQGTQTQGPFDQFFQDFFNRVPNAPQTGRTVTSEGSGFIIDKSGIIVTNNHVIADADQVYVIMHDGSRVPAQILGKDERADLAVLKINLGHDVPFVEWGDSDKARIGDWIIAIGNPYGLGSTITAGIISARARNINAGPYDDFIQTDASINRGNSGGPLMNTRGEVIGINTAIFSPTGASIGIGFSIPANLAKPIVNQIVEFGRPRRGWLGIRVQTVSDDMARSMGFTASRGALISGITTDGPAAKGGILPGDVVLQFDGRDIADMNMLPKVVAETAVDKTAKVQIWRKGALQSLDVKVGELADPQLAALTPAAPNGANVGPTTGALGMSLAQLTPELRKQFGVDADADGVLVAAVAASTDAAARRIQPGDVILEVAQKEVHSPEDVLKALDDSRKQNKTSVLILVKPKDGDIRFVALSLAQG